MDVSQGRGIPNRKKKEEEKRRKESERKSNMEFIN